MSSTRDLIRKELAGQRQRIRGLVVSEPTLLPFDSTNVDFAMWVVDVDIGGSRILSSVPVKLNSAGSRDYARLGAPVILEKDAHRYQVVGPGDRALNQAPITLVSETTGLGTSGGAFGFTFQRMPFTYYQGTSQPETIYNPATDVAVRTWLRTYERAIGRPARISVVADSDGSQVITVTDKSPLANSPTQATAANRPFYRRFSTSGGNVNKLCTADFDGSNDRLVFPSAITAATPGALSVFVLCNKDATGSGDDIVLELNHWRVYSRRSGGDTWGVDQGGGVSNSGGAVGASFTLLELVAASFNSFRLFQDGVELGLFTPLGSGLGLGSSSLGGSAALGTHDGRIAEVLVLDGAVSDSKRLLIERYFKRAMFEPYSKWGNGVDAFPKVRVLDASGAEVSL